MVNGKPSPKCKHCGGCGEVCGTCNRPANACVCSPSSRCSPYPCACLKRKSKAGSRHGRHKGNRYENEFCRELSLWWSCGLSKDLFEPVRGSGGKGRRSAASGEKATSTGDIIGVTERGARLTRLLKIELKRGYPDIDFPSHLMSHAGQLQQFISQAKQAAIDSCGNCDHYWLVLRQDRQPAWVIMEESFARTIHLKTNIGYPPGFLIARNSLRGWFRAYWLSELLADRDILKTMTLMAGSIE